MKRVTERIRVCAVVGGYQLHVITNLNQKRLTGALLISKSVIVSEALFVWVTFNCFIYEVHNLSESIHFDFVCLLNSH